MQPVNIDMAVELDDDVDIVDMPDSETREEVRLSLDTNILAYFRWMRGALGAQTPRELETEDGVVELGDENDYDPNWEPDYRGPGGNRAWWTRGSVVEAGKLGDDVIRAPSHAYIAIPYEVYSEEYGDEVYQG